MQKQYVGVGVLVLVVVVAGWYFVGSKEPKAAPVVTPAPGTPATTTDVGTSSAEESRATQVTNAENVLPPTTDADTPTRTDAEIERNIAELGYTMDEVKVYRDEKFGFEFMIPAQTTYNEGGYLFEYHDSGHQILDALSKLNFCNQTEFRIPACEEESVFFILKSMTGAIDHTSLFPANWQTSVVEEEEIVLGKVNGLRVRTVSRIPSSNGDSVEEDRIFIHIFHNNNVYTLRTDYYDQLYGRELINNQKQERLFLATFRFIKTSTEE
jgi:hypothetical protein